MATLAWQADGMTRRCAVRIIGSMLNSASSAWALAYVAITRPWCPGKCTAANFSSASKVSDTRKSARQ